MISTRQPTTCRFAWLTVFVLAAVTFMRSSAHGAAQTAAHAIPAFTAEAAVNAET
jgi:hypothetical protein